MFASPDDSGCDVVFAHSFDVDVFFRASSSGCDVFFVDSVDKFFEASSEDATVACSTVVLELALGGGSLLSLGEAGVSVEILRSG